MLVPLLPFQRQFLAWALKQERGDVRGGILADEMGMGKTIQALSVRALGFSLLRVLLRGLWGLLSGRLRADSAA